MLIPMLLSAVLSTGSLASNDRLYPETDKGSANLIYAQSEPEFLTSEQIRMLLIGTQVTHQPPGGPGEAQLTFKSDGKVKIRNFKGKKRTGGWKIKGPQVVCLSKIGGLGDKNFCVKLTFDGENIYHYIPATGEMMGVPPWRIKKPGPQLKKVKVG